MKRPAASFATELVLSPVAFLRRLAALVPPPEVHLARFFGVLAPNARLRPLAARLQAGVSARPPAASAPTAEPGAGAERPRRMGPLLPPGDRRARAATPLQPPAAGAGAWAGPLCHPVPLVAVLGLAVNDHLLKGSGLVPGSITGKLSDVAGLFFFPVLLAAVAFAALRLAGGDPRHRKALSLGAVAATAAAFSALKLWPAFNELVEAAWGANALDAADLFALPAAGLAGVWLWRARRPAARRSLEVAAILVAVLASAATSRSPRRVYPEWRIASPPREAGCATVTAWAVRSGKEGAGITVELDTGQPRCAVEIRGARFLLPSHAVEAKSLPPAMELAPGAVQRAWLAFPFDGDRAWNAGERTATLELSLLVAGELHRWAVTVVNRPEGGALTRQHPDDQRREAPSGAGR